jgi:DUF1680 family protein
MKRDLIIILFGCFLGGLSSYLMAQERTLVNVSESPYVLMRGVNLDDVNLEPGFWAERFEVCKRSMVPGMWELLSNPTISHAFRNFEIASGCEIGSHDGPPFHDGDFYKWFEALSVVYMQTGDSDIDSLMDHIIPFITGSQREDGYIHTPVIIEEAGIPVDELEFRDRLDFETYNMGHLMTAACMHFRATGKRTLLDAAILAADFLIQFYERSPEELAQNAICPSHYMGVTELYRTTGDKRYLELARNLLEIRELVKDGTDHNQDRIPFQKQTTAMGHAVRANYLYAGVADLVAETGDSILMQALEAIWMDLTLHKLYITGGCGALYDGVSPDGTSRVQSKIQQVHQAYGRPYQLPNMTAHNESCANIGSVLWSWRMLMLTADARYADLVERTLYNAVLPAVSLDGERYFYTNPLRVDHDLPYNLRWSGEREEHINCNCCPPNIVRTIAEIGNYFYSLSKEGIWLHIYGESSIETQLKDGSDFSLEQKTSYPWDGTIRVELGTVPDHEYSVFLRIPAWAKEASISINGKPRLEPLLPGSYAEISRKWKKGDIIELDLPMVPKLMVANPLVEENSNQVAIQRGPLVYCIESTDIPNDNRISDLVIPAGIKFEESFTSIDGAHCLVLDGFAGNKGARNSKNNLYQELTVAKPEPVKIRLIPYYAWGNRGKFEMSVWMGVDY